jgi:lipopolysaccharide export system protein LptC
MKSPFALAASLASRNRRHGSANYSRFVSLMKLLLPVAALALAAVMVAWPQLKSRDGGFRLGFLSINPYDAENLRMDNARFTGLDKNTLPYTLTADVAIQDGPGADIIRLQRPKGDVTLKDGTWLALTADKGLHRQKKQTLVLTGVVNLFHDSGHSFTTSHAEIDMIHGTAVGNQPVTGHGPSGDLTSQGFRFHSKDNIIQFTGKAKLVFYSLKDGPKGDSGKGGKSR